MLLSLYIISNHTTVITLFMGPLRWSRRETSWLPQDKLPYPFFVVKKFFYPRHSFEGIALRYKNLHALGSLPWVSLETSFPGLLVSSL